MEGRAARLLAADQALPGPHAGADAGAGIRRSRTQPAGRGRARAVEWITGWSPAVALGCRARMQAGAPGRGASRYPRSWCRVQDLRKGDRQALEALDRVRVAFGNR